MRTIAFLPWGLGFDYFVDPGARHALVGGGIPSTWPRPDVPARTDSITFKVKR